jgi:hypothetical protein
VVGDELKDSLFIPQRATVFQLRGSSQQPIGRGQQAVRNNQWSVTRAAVDRRQ